MRTKIQKWGNSLALRIPKAFARDARLDTNSDVDVKLEKNRIIIQPVKPKEMYLEDLLAGIKENNIHAEVNTDPAKGNEIW